MRALAIALVSLVLTGVSATSAESSWSVQGIPGSASFVLATAIKSAPHAAYQFNCSSPTHVTVTYIGVTKLTDAAKRRKVDENATELPPGASFMGLRAGDEDAGMVEANAVRNESGGWDLTIEVAKDDPAFLALPTAEKIMLFTTGKNTSVPLSDADRAIVADFVNRCIADPAHAATD
jgi:hypothetical protein